MDRYEAEQFLYDLRIDQADAEYEMELIGGDYLLVLDSNFRELNRLAQRIDEMGDFPRESFDAWLSAQDLCTVEDALLATYHTDWIEFHPGFDTDEMLGEFALENGIFEDYNYLPTDIYEMLDQAKVGARMREQDGGQFVEGGDLIAGDFSGEKLPAEKPLAFFQVRFSDGQDKSAWFELPLNEVNEQFIKTSFGRKSIFDLHISCRSSMPQIPACKLAEHDYERVCALIEHLETMTAEDL